MYKISFTVLIQIFLVLTLLKPSHSANSGSSDLANSYASLVSHYYNAVALSTKEMNNAISKDDFISNEDAELINKFLNKVIYDLNKNNK